MINIENFGEERLAPDFLLRFFTQNDWYLVVASLIEILDNNLPEQQENISTHLKVNGKVRIGNNCRISEYCVIDGPAYIGDNVEIGPHVYIRPGSVIGNNCVLGHASEVKNSLMMDGAKIANHTMLADSIMFARARLGGHSETMNRRYDQKAIAWKFEDKSIETNLTKLGAIIGEDTRVGGGVFLAPGVTIGKNCFIESGTNLTQAIAPYSFVKHKQELDIRDNKFRESLHSRDGLFNS